MLGTLFFLGLLAGQGAFGWKSYEGYQLLGATPGARQDVINLKEYLDQEMLDVWNDHFVIGNQVTFLVPPQKVQEVKHHIVNTLRMSVEVIREDVGQQVNAEKERLDQRKAKAMDEGRQFDYDPADFNTYDDMMSQLDVFATNCPGGFSCSVVTYGQSTEGQDIKGIQISGGSGRPIVWIDSLIHAREWIVGPTNMLIVDKLLTEYGNDADVTEFMDTYDWYIMPVVNPDGYEFTWSDDRFWRKSRNNNDGSVCIGTDLNRNFEYKWATVGSSDNPCTDTFHGSSAGSEPETQVIQDAAVELGSNVATWISMHSVANMWLHPFGSTENDQENGPCETSPDSDDQSQVALAAELACEDNTGNSWVSGSVCTTIYPAAGSTVDYVYATGGVKYPFTPELSGGTFDPPASYIPTALDETWAGIVALIREIESIEGLK